MTKTYLVKVGGSDVEVLRHNDGTFELPPALAALDGWGTALKPAVEDWYLARAPMSEKTVAANVARWGTGALAIDACRIGIDGGTGGGRWPAHLLLSHSPGCTQEDGTETIERWECVAGCAVAVLDAQSGITKTNGGGGRISMGYNGAACERVAISRSGDSGGASRFFYCSKPSTVEREMGLDDFTPATTDDGRETVNDTAYQRGATKRRNVHPTVKSVALMRWLMRLITPPGGVVLDLFAGSGTTGIAAMCERFRFVGVEAEAEFARIARARIAYAAANPRAFDPSGPSKAVPVDQRQITFIGGTQ